MLSTLCERPATDVKTECLIKDGPMLEDVFATAPIPAVKPLFQRDDEEELHTQFEQAISDRVFAVQARLNQISGPLADRRVMGNVLTITEALPEKVGVPFVMPRQLVLVCLGLMLVLIGFDLFGLLLVAANHIH